MPNQSAWDEIDRRITDLFVPADPTLDAVMQASVEAELPSIEVAPSHGKLLMLLARICGARRILEIGTLAGYSSIWMARALPQGGELVTLEADPKHARIALENFDRAGVADRIHLRLGPALETLPKLAEEKGAAFDLVFLDADKPSNPAYFSWALKLTRPGSIIIADNVVRYGALSGAKNDAPRDFLEVIAREPRVTATAIQTLSCKGHDGFALALVLS